MAAFAGDVKNTVRDGFDRSVAFQTMPGTDFLFLADMIRSPADAPSWKRLKPRYRAYARLEQECFSEISRTQIIGLAATQMAPFIQRYGVSKERIRIAPPTLSRQKYDPSLRSPNKRAILRRDLELPGDACVWLWLGLVPKTKGLDRVIAALGARPGTRLLIGGLDPSGKAAAKVIRNARLEDIGDRVRFLGYLPPRKVLEAMAASDVLAHPARVEVTGGVILESIINGLPVVATSNCGFAEHIRQSGAGMVLEEPFDQERFVRLLDTVCGVRGEEMSARGLEYGTQIDAFSGLDRICDWIEAGSLEVPAAI